VVTRTTNGDRYVYAVATVMAMDTQRKMTNQTQTMENGVA
jgi:hypothetical protein